MNLKTTISAMIFLLLMVTMLLVQTHLKVNSLTVWASFTAVTLLSFIFKQDKLSTLLLIPIVLLSSYLFWFLVSNEIKNILFSSRQTHGHFVMDLSFLYCIPMAVLLALVTTFMYFKRMIRCKQIERYGLKVYLAATLIIIFRHKLF